MSKDAVSIRRGPALALLLFSIFYFVDAYLRASEKFFWFDELCTLYICRLPTFGESWQAVLHGADYNPPLFYVIERSTRALFGDGLVAMRLPAILGIWIFSLSLYRVISRRAGSLAGFVALLLPPLTVAGYYACEARPHAIVLGFCGLALVSWQMLLEQPRSKLWLTALSAGLAAAFFTHCYAITIAIPFAITEIVFSVRAARVRWSIWLAMIIPGTIAAITYVPLLHAYKVSLAHTGFAYLFRAGFWQIPHFYLLVLSPCISVVVVAVIGLVLARRVSPPLPTPELTAGIAFVLLPLFAVLFALIVQGPFIARYFLASVAGFALLFGLASGVERSRNWLAILLLAVMAISAGKNFGTLLWHRHMGVGETMEEPAIKIPMNTTPGMPLADYSLILSDTGNSLPIVIAEPMDFLYLVYYSPDLVPRLYYAAASKDENNYHLYNNVQDWCHVKYNRVTTYREFAAAHNHFFVYGDPPNLGRLSALTKDGAQVSSFKTDEHHFLAEVTGPPR